VIRDAMQKGGRVALAKIVLTSREHVMAIEPFGKIMLGTILRYDYEVRDEKGLARSVATPKIPKQEPCLPHSRQQGGALRALGVQG